LLENVFGAGEDLPIRSGWMGAIGVHTQEEEVKRAREQERLYTSLKYKSGRMKEGGGMAGGHDDVPLCPPTLSVPSQLLEVEEGVDHSEEVGERRSDCDDLSWLVPLGNVCV